MSVAIAMRVWRRAKFRVARRAKLYEFRLLERLAPVEGVGSYGMVDRYNRLKQELWPSAPGPAGVWVEGDTARLVLGVAEDSWPLRTVTPSERVALARFRAQVGALEHPSNPWADS